MRGKEVVSSPASEEHVPDIQVNSPHTFKLAARNAASKYDFVKVKVWLGDNADHYYVLSRFLLSRMLTVTKIPNHVAVKIALELKKLLIDNSLLDVSQSDLEANLFKLMERRGFGEEYINRYRMITRFYHQRVPLVILVCGTGCSGKSTIATQLAQRLNLPNVLQTDMVYELLRTSTDAPLTSTPIWARDFATPEELITEFCRECRIVRKGLAGDLKKAMKDGKPIIIEGVHLDPSIYLMNEDDRAASNSSRKSEEPVSGTTKRKDEDGDKCSSAHSKETGRFSGEDLNISSNVSPSLPQNFSRSEDVKKCDMSRREWSSDEQIFVPIILRMAEFDHKALLEEWLSTRSFGGIQVEDRVISNLKTIQDYLCSFDSQGLTVVDISATTFPQTLDWLHGYLLQCIEQGLAAPTKKKVG